VIKKVISGEYLIDYQFLRLLILKLIYEGNEIKRNKIEKKFSFASINIGRRLSDSSMFQFDKLEGEKKIE